MASSVQAEIGYCNQTALGSTNSWRPGARQERLWGSMEDFLKPENIKLLSQVVLPGFVIAYVRSQFLPNRRLELKDAIVGYIALSVAPLLTLTPRALD